MASRLATRPAEACRRRAVQRAFIWGLLLLRLLFLWPWGNDELFALPPVCSALPSVIRWRPRTLHRAALRKYQDSRKASSPYRDRTCENCGADRHLDRPSEPRLPN